MTPEELDAIEARASKATEGPWADASDHPSYAIYVANGTNGSYRVVQTPNQNNERRFGSSERWLGISSYNDALFIAAARQDVPALVAEVRRLRSGLNVLATTFYKDDQHQDYAKHILGAQS